MMLDHSVVRALQSRYEAPPPASRRRRKERVRRTRVVLRPAPAR